MTKFKKKNLIFEIQALKVFLTNYEIFFGNLRYLGQKLLKKYIFKNITVILEFFKNLPYSGYKINF